MVPNQGRRMRIETPKDIKEKTLAAGTPGLQRRQVEGAE